MNRGTMSRILAVALCGTTVVFAGCAGNRGATPYSAFLPNGGVHAHPSVPKHRSWMEPDAKSEDLLYVSNSNGEVGVYRYWQHTLVGLLTDFTSPMGQCVDNSQDVYITDSAAKQILEYAHAGTKPIKTYDDSPDSPYACWIDPTTGNLAVANDDGASQAGNIAIWSAASGSRSTYTDSTLNNFEGCAYDDKGNLLVTNGNVEYPNYTFFAWLPKNGSKLINVNIPGPRGSWRWGYVLGIQWDGKFFAIDDGSTIYRESLLHGQAYYVGETYASDEDEGNASPFAIYDKGSAQGTQIVEGMDSDERSNEVGVLALPGGRQRPNCDDHARHL